MPKLYDGWFNDQISKQASTAVSKAISAGKVRLSNTYRVAMLLEYTIYRFFFSVKNSTAVTVFCK